MPDTLAHLLHSADNGEVLNKINQDLEEFLAHLGVRAETTKELTYGEVVIKLHLTIRGVSPVLTGMGVLTEVSSIEVTLDQEKALMDEPTVKPTSEGSIH